MYATAFALINLRVHAHMQRCTHKCRHTDLSEPFKVMYLMAEVKNRVDYEHSTSEGGLKYLQEEQAIYACIYTWKCIYTMEICIYTMEICMCSEVRVHRRTNEVALERI